MLEQIKASAGSGKTHTLTMRFLELLSSMSKQDGEFLCRRALKNTRKAQVFSEILAMTFTNKAASEMKERVISTLKQTALSAIDGSRPEALKFFTPEEAKEWLELILKRYDALNIRTIDSLLNLLLRISAIKLNLAPDFELCFDSSDLFSPLYDEILERATQDPEIYKLFAACANFIVYHTRFEGMTPRGRIRTQLLDVLTLMQREATVPDFEVNELYARRTKALEELRCAASAFEGYLTQNNIRPLANFTNFLTRCAQFEGKKELPTSKYAFLASFTECMRTTDKTVITPETEQAYFKFQAELIKQKQRFQIYSSAISLAPFARLAAAILPEVSRQQKESGLLESSAVPLLASTVLEDGAGVSEALCRMGSNLSHLLIDEFQDTSREQWSAIEPLAVECLSKGGSLRYVGDVKQAIYSWRGGDSTLFDEVTEMQSLRAMEPEVAYNPLGENWRSSPVIINYNNRFFSRLAAPEFASAATDALLGDKYPEHEKNRVSTMIRRVFSGVEQKIPPAKKHNTQGFVQVKKIIDESTDAFVERVKDELYELFVNNLAHRRKHGDIAVLVRKKAEAALLSDWLMSWGFNVVTEHSFKLSSHPLIQRILALLRFLDYPLDDLSFFNFISGPECLALAAGLPDTYQQNIHEWVLRVRAEQKSKESFKPLFTYFMRDFPELWSKWLSPFYSKANLMTAYDTASEIISHFSLNYHAPQAQVYLKRFLEVVYAADNKGFSSLAGFLEFWEEQGQEEKVPSPETPDAVEIITIHKAKGLEKPVVVMPFHRFTESKQADLTIAEFEGLKLLLKDTPELGAYHFTKKNTATVEKLHLLYVGWTRAKEELYIYTGCKEKELKSAGVPRLLEFMFKDYSFEEAYEGDTPVYTSGEQALAHQTQVIINSSANMNSSSTPCSKQKFNTAVNSADLAAGSLCNVSSAGTMLPAEHTPDKYLAGSTMYYPAMLTEKTAGWHPMQWMPRLKVFKNNMPETIYDERVRGTFFHNCLENLYVPESTDTQLDFYIRQAISHTFAKFPLSSILPDTLPDEAHAALSWFCSDAEHLSWLRYGIPEQTIIDAKGKAYRADLLVDEGGKGITVIEYKSGKAYAEHKEQLNNYLTLLRGAQHNFNNTASQYKGVVRGVLVYLDSHKKVEFC